MADELFLGQSYRGPAAARLTPLRPDPTGRQSAYVGHVVVDNGCKRLRGRQIAMARIFRGQHWHWPLAGLAAIACAGLGVAMTASSPVATGSAGAASTSLTATTAVTGFWNGTDSNNIAISGSAPYQTPAIGGGVYWFMGGPGVDPRYNGTTHEAAVWGDAQAATALSTLNAATGSHKPNYPIIFMDVELPGHAPGYTPAADNGWNSVYTSACSGVVKQNYVPAGVDRAEFNAFANYVTSHSSYKAGVYSAPSIWRSIFGTGSYASIPNTYEWTYTADTSSLSHHPNGWCLSGTSTCASFFGGQTSTSKYAVMWQWSGGGGTYNGYGDFDQIDASRTP